VSDSAAANAKLAAIHDMDMKHIPDFLHIMNNNCNNNSSTKTGLLI
jgi:hypothetical protein